jgi:hypothetical protein
VDSRSLRSRKAQEGCIMDVAIILSFGCMVILTSAALAAWIWRRR